MQSLPSQTFARQEAQSAGVLFGRPRRGFTILELVVSATILGAALTVALPALGWVLRERQATHRQQDAVQEVHNVLERITVRPWNEISEEGLSSVEPADAIKNQLPQAELKISVAAVPQSEDARRVMVVLGWRPRPEQPQATVSATAWVYRAEVAP